MCNACAECGNGNDQQADQQAEADQEAEQAAAEDQQQEAGANRKLVQYSVDCSTCYSDCLKIENMQANGYIDATNFLQCRMIYDPADDGKAALYAGPMCASQGYKIKIGVFTDENCNNNDSSKDVENYLVNGDGYAMKLSHALLKTVYAADTCVSCEASEEDQNADGEGSNVLGMCGELYEAAAKCEKPHGFDNGFSGYSGYENQASNEGVVCDFIDSIGAGSYDEQGEIVVYGASGAYGAGGAKTTGGQKFALTFFILGTVGLAMYAGMLHSKLTKGAMATFTVHHDGAMA
jgi:hypothetical protein